MHSVVVRLMHSQIWIHISTSLTSFSALNKVITLLSHIGHSLNEFCIDISSNSIVEKTKLKSTASLLKSLQQGTTSGKGQNVVRKRPNIVAIAKQSKQQTRDYDPLWTYVLLECAASNDIIKSYSTECFRLIRLISTFNWNEIMGCGKNNHSVDPAIMNIIYNLLHGNIPEVWLNSSMFATCGRRCDVANWLQQFSLKHSMLLNWISKGIPCKNLQLHYLCSPEGLIQSLLEFYSWKNQRSWMH